MKGTSFLGPLLGGKILTQIYEDKKKQQNISVVKGDQKFYFINHLTS